MIYTHPKYDHLQEVDPRETVRRRLLERAGWYAQKDVPASPTVFNADAEAAKSATVRDVFDAKLADLLENAGLALTSQVSDAPDSILLEISGVGPAKLAHIREVLGG